MHTPICDFVRKYADQDMLRFHMPGHKGSGFLGLERLDITEISGADSLYEAGGIIRESEENASALFGCPSFYSTEGSSLCIRATLYLALLHAKQAGKAPRIAAARNVHKTFISAAALLDLDVKWIYPEMGASYLSCRIEADALDRLLSAESIAAVYVTSPDYLGNTADVEALARVCHQHGALLLVDNAHGAYLRFLPESRHPIDLGADMCCDSAHKTLPVLTGGAYLHIAPSAPELFVQQAKQALALFGSTSPSYLILQSLDACNRVLSESYRAELAAFTLETGRLKQELARHGYILCGDEEMKLTISAKPFGYTGMELSDFLLSQGIVSEFADPDYIVFMFAPENGAESLHQLKSALMALPRRNAIAETAPAFRNAEQLLSIREAALSPSEIIPACESEGRILAAATVGCPPAVPIVVCGERIDRHAIECFRYYGIENCIVIK